MKKEMKDTLKKIDDLREELKKAEKGAAKEIMGILKELMGANPALVGMRWNQYTPSFNDGDPCEFGINGPEFKFELGAPTKTDEDNEDEDYDGGSGDGFFDSWELDDEFFEKRTDILNHKEVPKIKKAMKDAVQVFEKLTQMESQMESMFGDGVQVTVTADGVEVEDYDHD